MKEDAKEAIYNSVNIESFAKLKANTSQNKEDILEKSKVAYSVAGMEINAYYKIEEIKKDLESI